MSRALTMNLTISLLSALTGAAFAQYTPPPPPLTTAPCVSTKKDPCSQPPAPAPAAKPGPAEEFPFPEDNPAAPAASKASPPDAPGPTNAGANAGARPGASGLTPAAAQAASEHPFPEDDPSSSSSSSSSSSGGADIDDKAGDKPALKDLGSEGTTKFQRRKLAKVEDPQDRESEDLSVSKFYEDRGNFRAAYMRAQDAVKTLPDDPEAHLRLAQTAVKMQKKDEAVAEYNLYLKLDPQGDHVKSVREALAELR